MKVPGPEIVVLGGGPINDVPDVLAHLEKGDAQSYQEVWRNDRIFVGLRVDLAKVTEKRVQELIEHAWRNRGPTRLVAEYDSRPAVRPSVRPADG